MSDMTSTQQLLKARFNVVRRDLDQVLAQLTDDMLPWAPAEGMRTIRGQLFEIVGKEVELLDWAKQGGQGEWNEVDSFGEGESTVEGWKEILDAVRNETL